LALVVLQMPQVLTLYFLQLRHQVAVEVKAQAFLPMAHQAAVVIMLQPQVAQVQQIKVLMVAHTMLA
jgi:hypothetical protein